MPLPKAFFFVVVAIFLVVVVAFVIIVVIKTGYLWKDINFRLTKISFKSGVNPTYYSDHQPTFLIFYQENSQCTTYMEVDCDISKINQCFKKNNDFIEPNDSPSTEIDKPNALTTIQTKPFLSTFIYSFIPSS